MSYMRPSDMCALQPTHASNDGIMRYKCVPAVHAICRQLLPCKHHYLLHVPCSLRARVHDNVQPSIRKIYEFS
eukprot:5972693-Pyramimonas_sp.AAC.1